MKIFITGTDTNIGKTVISSWLALHTGFAYVKPIQSGTIEGLDSEMVKDLSAAHVYPESYRFREPVSPHLAAKIDGQIIDLAHIALPAENHLIVEGAGGLLVPLNDTNLMIDLIQKLKTSVILVTRTTLGTINHTLLSLEALKARGIAVLGVIMNGEPNPNNKQAIEFYGKTCVLAEFPKLNDISYHTLKAIPLPQTLQTILNQP